MLSFWNEMLDWPIQAVNYKLAGPMAWMGKSHLLCIGKSNRQHWVLARQISVWALPSGSGKQPSFYCCGVSRSLCLLNDPLLLHHNLNTFLAYHVLSERLALEESIFSLTRWSRPARCGDSREGGASYECNIMSSCSANGFKVLWRAPSGMAWRADHRH